MVGGHGSGRGGVEPTFRYRRGSRMHAKLESAVKHDDDDTIRYVET